MLYIKYGKISEFGATCESLVTNSGAIPVLFQRNPTIPVPFRQIPVIPADSGAIPAELPDSGRNLWGTVKYCVDNTRKMGERPTNPREESGSMKSVRRNMSIGFPHLSGIKS